MNKNKQIAVVTGANGFIGSHLVDYLLEKKYIVRCIVREQSDIRWLKDKEVELYRCGLSNIVELEKILLGAEYIYHVAGVVKAKTPKGYYEGNVNTTENLLNASMKISETIRKIVIVSSGAVTGPSEINMPNTEDANLNPITEYGKSKAEEERLCSYYMNKLPITICRPPAMYGERDTEIFVFFQTYKRGLFPTIGFKDKQISLLHVKDLVEGLYLAAMSDKSKSKTYFLSSEKYYSWYEIGEATKQAFGKNALHIKIPHFIVYLIAAISQIISIFGRKASTLNIEKAKDIIQNAWTFSPAKAMEELGFRQRISLDEGVAKTIKWYTDNKWL